MSVELQQALKQYFGHSNFRPGQRAVCESILAGNDTLAVFPTGAGKSVCYQLPALLLPGLTLVFSPLISLMQDQVMQLNRKNIAATYVSSSLKTEEYHDRLLQLKTGKYKLLYLAPEQLKSERVREVLKILPVSVVVIDEAHCISEWGHDFRPSYREITEKLSQYWEKRPVIAAYTGTATPATRADIVATLQLNNASIFTTSLLRKNLQLQILSVSSSAAREVVLLLLLKKHVHLPTIIYCATRQQTEYCLQLIKQAFGSNTPGAVYHAGLEKDVRKRVQDEFIEDRVHCIVATTAFGMGIDKPNIGCIIHYQMPGSIEQYVQEVGRAGRNGQSAWCYLLWNEHDRHIQEEMLQQSANQNQKREKLTALLKYCSIFTCRHQALSQYFSEEITRCETSCDYCTGEHFNELKHSCLLDKTDLEKIEKYKRIRNILASDYQIAPEYILTEQQLWWLCITEPRDLQSYRRIPGIGQGWIKQWYQSFTEIHDKIQ